MEFDSFLGVPAHPLFVHVPIAFIPLAALGAIALALQPRWRPSYGWLVVLFTALGAAGAQLATGSGESLEEGRQIRDIGDHPELGELARTLGVILLALVVTLYLLERWRDHSRLRRVPAWVTPVVAALTVVGAIGATAAVVAAGHTGAKSVWEEDDGSTATNSGP
jgi:uncharacterized membrane protein